MPGKNENNIYVKFAQKRATGKRVEMLLQLQEGTLPAVHKFCTEDNINKCHQACTYLTWKLDYKKFLQIG